MYLKFLLYVELRYAVKAIQKSRVRDYETFKNEIKILRTLVYITYILFPKLGPPKYY